MTDTMTMYKHDTETYGSSTESEYDMSDSGQPVGDSNAVALAESVMPEVTYEPDPSERPAPTSPVELPTRPDFALSPILDSQSYSAVEMTRSYTRLSRIAAEFAPITLDEMAEVALLDRTETKYVINLDTLFEVMPALMADYRSLDVLGNRINRYRTLYFDTDDFQFYRRHHMGARNRYKVRSREYEDTRLAFFEVKHKKSKRRTVKYRLSTPRLLTTPDPESDEFLNSVTALGMQELQPKTWNRYRRITLVSKYTPERVTLDVDVHFSWGASQIGMPGLVIAEVKRPLHGQQSAFAQLMRSKHVHSSGFSKYCMGISLLYPGIKHNRFKPLHRQVARLMEEYQDVYH